MKISIILKTWNALPYVKVCLESLFSKTLMPFELIIIDNNSSKDLKDYLKSVEKNNKNVKLICNCENIGPAQSNILGLSEASGDFICLIDSDLLFSHNWLKKLFETMIDKSFHIVVPMKYHESIMYPFEQSISSRAKWF
jgi:glycosyltransferase involved in cell wall biosynthesis